MLIHNTEHKFYYIDPTLSNEQGDGGDGSSAANASRNFPSTWEDNTIYLVRRSAVGLVALLPYSNNSSLTFNNVKSVVIMGMPKTDDPMFTEMPADAKSAWVDAEREWAWIRMPFNGRYGTKFTSCRKVHISRVCFEDGRTENNEAACLSFSSSFGTEIYLENCRFKYSGFDFTAEGDTNDTNYYRGQQWLTGCTDVFANSATVLNCRFDKWGRGWAINLGRVRNIRIEDCEAHVTQCRDAVQPIITWSPEDQQNAPEVKVKNIKYYAYYNNHCEDPYCRPFVNNTVNRIFVDNVTVAMGEHQNHSAYQNRFYMSGVICANSMNAGSIMENVTVDLPTLKGRNSNILYFKYIQNQDDGRYWTPSRGQYNIFRNITINACTEYTDTLNDFTTWDQNPFTDYDNGLLVATTESSYQRNASTDYLLQNIHITAPFGIAMKVYQAMIDMSDCDIQGSVYASLSLGKIKSISSWYPGYAFNDGGRNTLYIGSITCNRSNPRWEYNSQVALSVNWHSYILCGSSNIRFVTNNFSSESMDSYKTECAYICTNNMQEGNFTVRSRFSQAQTWSVYRVGSTSNCSIRLSNEIQNDSRRPIEIGGAPFKGITLPASAGERTLTFHMTLYGYNDPTEIPEHFQATIELPDGSKIFSQAGHWEAEDDAVWENVDGSTSFKLTIPFTMPEDGNVTVSYRWFWYMVDAATFVDPFPVIA